MLPEQQQRILGYFIEEARDHLNTIEQGLLNLQNTLNDPEMVNEVFRAAHSIKGGAAMLGLSSIQQTAHRLEDCFKVLKEHPVQVDQKLESLFLGVSDTLKALLEHLQGPFGLSDDVAHTLMSETEPVFQWLNEHLELLVKQQGGGQIVVATHLHTDTFSRQEMPPPAATQSNNLEKLQNAVLQTLREMLQQFKQTATTESRQNLKECCQQLVQLGKQMNLSNWSNLCQAAGNAIAYPENSYLILAKTVITEIKQALELVLGGREGEVKISPQLEALLPEIELLDNLDDNNDITANLFDESAVVEEVSAPDLDLFADTFEEEISGNLTSNLLSLEFESIDASSDDLFNFDDGNLNNKNNNDNGLASQVANTSNEKAEIFQFLPEDENQRTFLKKLNLDPRGPEVGTAELSTLAQLFEGDNTDLNNTWEIEEGILDSHGTGEAGIEVDHSDTEAGDRDVNDLLLEFDEDAGSQERSLSASTTEDLTSLFDDNFLEEENQEVQSQETLNQETLNQETLNQETAQAKADNHRFDTLFDNSLNKLTDISPVNIEQINENITSTNGNIKDKNQEKNVADDLLTLTGDENESVTTNEINSPEIENISQAIPENISEVINQELTSTEITPTPVFSNTEISAQQQNSLDELFSETVAQPIEEITFDDPIESNKSLPKNQGLSLENLFDEPEKDKIIPTDDLPFGELFDASPATAEFSPSSDELRNFWEQEDEEAQNSELANVEQHAASALERTLFEAVASGDIFGDSEESIASSEEGFDLEDLDLTFHQQEQQFDLMFLSNSDADLLAELTPTFIENRKVFPQEIGTFVEQQDSPIQSVNPSPTLSPENLDLTPEFTHEAPVEESLSDVPKSFADLEVDLFNTIDQNNDVNQQIQLQDIPTANSENDIEFDATENPFVVQQQDLAEDLLADISFNEDFLLNFDSPESEILPEVIDFEAKTTLQPNLEFAEASVSENANIEDFQLDLVENLFGGKAAISEDKNQEELIEQEATISDEQALNFNAFNSDLDGLNLETGDLEAGFSLDALGEVGDFSEHFLDNGEPTEALPFEIVENTDVPAIVSLTEEITEQSQQNNDASIPDEFADLEALLGEEIAPNSIAEDDFAALEVLLGTDDELPTPTPKQQFTPYTSGQPAKAVSSGSSDIEDEFGDLEKLLAEADQSISSSSSVNNSTNKNQRASTRRGARFEQTMRVPVKHLDDMNNLVGELVVNRNTLEQDQERQRQSLDNLLHQVQQLSDVGARMQELYERSLLEASLLASRKSKEFSIQQPVSDFNADRGFSELEMDRFTPFHTLSQEMIELIVRVRESASDIDFVTEETERVARQFRQVTTQLQEGLTRARMVPFAQATDRLERGVRDNAIKCGKQVKLVIEGRDTLIDKMILEHLTDPLVHMLNNAIAHGIEMPEEREAAGKSPVGIITVRAFHQGNQTIISVGDDGAGIDHERVKAKALNVGLITAQEAKTMLRVDVYDLLFQSGFSTKDQADDLAGRGVGMDVVRTSISEIRGTINTDSKLGKGTTFTIRLPLTLSICKALCCVSDKARVAFPMDGVEDTLDIHVKSIQQGADGQQFISWRDTNLPFKPLKDLLTFNRQLSRGNVYGGNRDDDMVSVVVVRSASTLLGLQVDLVLSEQEIVIKQFEGPAPKPIGVAGATVLGDGRIMPIADVLEIVDIFHGRMSKQSSVSLWEQKSTPLEKQPEKIDPTVLIVDDSITVRELLSLTFNKAGYRVEQARDGQEAWDKLRSGLPCDIVFCDIEMPRCDGLELLSRIQKESSLNHLPIAMLTSRGADKHRQMAVQLGASGYFTKPYLEEALLEAASRMLKGEKLVSSTSNT
jgi:chemotaxis protein histidine kinase CheA/ActR/RegA family two-component response regulator